MMGKTIDSIAIAEADNLKEADYTADTAGSHTRQRLPNARNVLEVKESQRRVNQALFYFEC